LPPGAPDWDAFLLAAIDAVLAPYPEDLAGVTWGQSNRTRIEHPLAGALPDWLGRRLNMPALALPGDAYMPRVQGSAFGASERLVVAPGHEDSAILHMPAGQSGHPLSAFFAADHADWAQAAPTPLLPGETRYTLVLSPHETPQ
jgi:penicillin amidase